MNKQEKIATVTTDAETEKLATSGNPRGSLSPVFVEAEKLFEKLAEVTKETAQRAYEFFQKRGGEFGKELDDWFNAEAKVLRPVPVEVTETDSNVNVSAAVPGFKPEEIEISIKDNLLIMSGRTEKREERSEENVVYSDWESNRFFRQLTLPSVVDTENVRAELKDGILRLTLPKVAARETKHVAVSAG